MNRKKIFFLLLINPSSYLLGWTYPSKEVLFFSLSDDLNENGPTQKRKKPGPSPHTQNRFFSNLDPMCVWWGALYKSSRSVTVFSFEKSCGPLHIFRLRWCPQVEEKDGRFFFSFWHVYYRTRDSYPPRHTHTQETCKHSIYQFSPHVPTAKAPTVSFPFIFFLFIRFVSLMIRSNGDQRLKLF